MADALAYKLIPLVRKRNVVVGYATVDDAVYVAVAQQRWYLANVGYAVCKINGKMTYLHHFILRLLHPEAFPLAKGIITDHVNRDKLDNRRDNLRLTTQVTNQANKRMQANNTSGYVGVSWDRRRSHWVATINAEGKHHYLGGYSDPVAAARRVNEAYRYYHPDVAVPNPQAEEVSGAG